MLWIPFKINGYSLTCVYKTAKQLFGENIRVLALVIKVSGT